MRFEVVSGVKGLESVRDSWKAITTKMNHRRFFHLYEWYSAYLRCLENHPDSVHFFLGYRGGEPVALFPLKECMRHVCGMRMRSLELPSHPHLPLCDLVFPRQDDNGGIVSAFCDFLRRQKPIRWDVIFLPLLLDDSSALCSLDRSKLPRTIVKEWDRCCYLVCDDNDAICQGYTKKFRRNLRTARNHLDKMDQVEFVSSTEHATLSEAFRAFLDVEASGWKGTGGTGSAIKLSPPLKCFYERLLRDFSASKACEINLLKAGGRCLAGQFCLLVDDTRYLLKVGYDEAFRKASPGNMLLEWVLRKPQDDTQVRVLSFVTSANWLRSWNPSSMPVYRAWLFNRSMRGLWAAPVLRARWAAGAASRQILTRKPKSATK